MGVMTYRMAAMFGSGKVWRIVRTLPNFNQSNFSLSMVLESIHLLNSFCQILSILQFAKH